MHPRKKTRTYSALEEEMFHTFQHNNHASQPVTSNEQCSTFSSLSTDLAVEGAPAVVAALNPTKDNSLDTCSESDIGHMTTFEDEQGFLSKTPCTPEEKVLLYHLLQPSKEQYTSFTHRVPPEVDSNMSYLWQYGELAGSLTQWWRSHGHESLRPNLVGLVDCTSSQLTWNTPSPPQLSVHIATLWTAVFPENIVKAEPVLDDVDQQADSAWDDDCFNAYIHLDKTEKPLSIPSEEVDE